MGGMGGLAHGDRYVVGFWGTESVRVDGLVERWSGGGVVVGC